MKTKTINLYEFEELPKGIQEKVLENERYINVDCDWHDYDGKTGFDAKELKRMHLSPEQYQNATDLLEHKKLYFDLDRGWYIQFVDAEFSDEEIARKFLRVPKKLWDVVCWRINDCPSRETNTRLEYEDWNQDTGKEFTDKQKEILDRAVELFSDKVDEALKDLRNSYEYLLTDEAVKETILCNEYTFTITGKLENT